MGIWLVSGLTRLQILCTYVDFPDVGRLQLHQPNCDAFMFRLEMKNQRQRVVRRLVICMSGLMACGVPEVPFPANSWKRSIHGRVSAPLCRQQTVEAFSPSVLLQLLSHCAHTVPSFISPSLFSQTLTLPHFYKRSTNAPFLSAS